MKEPSQRQLRVGEEVRLALARLFERGDFRNPELAAAHVTVTEVRASPDLRHMTVFVTPLGGGDAAALLAALRRAAPYLRTQVAKSVRTRYAPSLVFRADTTIDAAARLEALLHSPEVARDLQDPNGLGGGDSEPGAASAGRGRTAGPS